MRSGFGYDVTEWTRSCGSVVTMRPLLQKSGLILVFPRGRCQAEKIFPSRSSIVRWASAASRRLWVTRMTVSPFALVELLEDPADLLAPGGVEVPGRLVGEKDVGLVHERAGDGHPLHLAAGELAGQVAGALVEAEELQDPPDILFGPGLFEEGEGQDDVLEDGQRRRRDRTSGRCSRRRPGGCGSAWPPTDPCSSRRRPGPRG